MATDPLANLARIGQLNQGRGRLKFDPWADRVLDAVSLTDIFGGH